MIAFQADSAFAGSELPAGETGQSRTVNVSYDGVGLQRYHLKPGAWQHEPLEFLRVAVQESGTPKLDRVIEGKRERQLRPIGKISVSPAHTSQRWEWDCDIGITLLFVKQTLVEEIASEAGVSRQRLCFRTPLVAEDSLIRHVVAELVVQAAECSSISRMLIGTAGRHIAAHLVARYVGTPRQARHVTLPEWKLKRVLDYIEANLVRDIGLEEVSEVVDMTPHYFCRAFKRSLGVPPYRYLLGRRIERSKELLTQTEKSILEIALAVGFSNHAHFGSAFLKVTGCTPTEYRNRSRP
jgi:AraC family transcriptional regulator